MWETYQMTHKAKSRIESVKDQTVEELLSSLPSTDAIDTASALMEVYEAVERSYRAAVMAGEVQPSATQSTNY